MLPCRGISTSRDSWPGCILNLGATAIVVEAGLPIREVMIGWCDECPRRVGCDSSGSRGHGDRGGTSVLTYELRRRGSRVRMAATAPGDYRPGRIGRRARWHDDPGRVGRSVAVDRQPLGRHFIRWAATPAGAVAGHRAARSVIVIPGPRDRAVRHGAPASCNTIPGYFPTTSAAGHAMRNNMK